MNELLIRGMFLFKKWLTWNSSFYLCGTLFQCKSVQTFIFKVLGDDWHLISSAGLYFSSSQLKSQLVWYMLFFCCAYVNFAIPFNYSGWNFLNFLLYHRWNSILLNSQATQKSEKLKLAVNVPSRDNLSKVSYISF